MGKILRGGAWEGGRGGFKLLLQLGWGEVALNRPGRGGGYGVETVQ